MSTTIMAACWPLQMKSTQKAVLISLADNANDQGVCWPSISTICTRTCLSKSAVIEAIKWLEEAGVLEADRGNRYRTSYTIRVDRYNAPNVSATRTSPPHGLVRQNDFEVRQPENEVRQPDTNRQEPKEEKQKHTREKGKKPKREKPRELTFDAWLETIPDGSLVIADDDPIYGWMDAAGIPADWQDLAWLAFCDRFTGAAKTYADWRAAFRNYVKAGWLDVWRAFDGRYVLTTKGEQLRRVRDAQGQAA